MTDDERRNAIAVLDTVADGLNTASMRFGQLREPPAAAVAAMLAEAAVQVAAACWVLARKDRDPT